MFRSRPSLRLIPLVLLSLASLPALAADEGHDHHGNHPAHVHGVGKLDVALEGNTLTLHLDSPLINLVGFEHAASSGKDKDTVRAAVKNLREVNRMFATDAAAQCKPAEVQLESAVLTPALLGEKTPASKGEIMLQKTVSTSHTDRAARAEVAGERMTVENMMASASHTPV